MVIADIGNTGDLFLFGNFNGRTEREINNETVIISNTIGPI